MEDQKQQSGLAIIGDAIFNFVKGTAPDFAETVIDAFSNDGFLKDLPIVGTIVSGIKSIVGIRDAFFTKHVLVFTQQLNSGAVPQEKIKQHYEDLKNNPKKKLRELEAVLQSISKHKKYIQDKILANFYAAYCDPDVVDFNWTQFELMSQITEGLFPYDLIELKKIYDAEGLKAGQFDVYAVMRLSSLGLVTYDSGALTWVSTISNETPDKVTINKIGKAFWNYGMKNVESDLEKLPTDGTIL